MTEYTWQAVLKHIFDTAIDRYAEGARDLDTFFTPGEIAELETMGLRPIDVFDVAEDHVVAGSPDWGTVLLVAAARRDYFLHVQRGTLSGHRTSAEALPAKDAELAGIRWLPRIIAKARAKLRGELPDDIMYGCGGDRAFLKRLGIHPADFLRVVWAAGDDDDRILEYVRASAEAAGAGITVPAGAPKPSGDFCPV